jgi:hypothetical protein
MAEQRRMSRNLWFELAAVTLLAALAAASLPLMNGYLGWSWDAINHQVYLGMTAEQPRWHLDVLAASGQTYQYPYLYWPIYRMALLDAEGAWVAAAWAAAQAACVTPPVWLAAYRMLPQQSSAMEAATERAAACVLGAMSIVLWASLQTTANDLLAATPLLWAVAIALKPDASNRRLLAMGALFGVSVAFKLSNVLFAPFMLMWWFEARLPYLPLKRGLRLWGGAAIGFLVAYAPWGWQLWAHMGHPLYPFMGR